MVGIRVRVIVRFGVRVRVRVKLRSEICKLNMRRFEIAQRILQIGQLGKSCAT